MRRAVSLVVLSAHVAAAGHLLAASHAMADSGAVVEAQAECPQQGHGSAGIAHGHELQREERECTAVAFVRGSARVTAAPLSFAAPLLIASAVVPVEQTVSPLPVLSVAPKASPPV